jgi:hypothetical protein
MDGIGDMPSCYSHFLGLWLGKVFLIFVVGSCSVEEVGIIFFRILILIERMPYQSSQ